MVVSASLEHRGQGRSQCDTFGVEEKERAYI